MNLQQFYKLCNIKNVCVKVVKGWFQTFWKRVFVRLSYYIRKPVSQQKNLTKLVVIQRSP